MMRQIQHGSSEWTDIKTSASILWRASTHPDINNLRDNLRDSHQDSKLTIKDLHTGINSSRRAVLTSSHEQIILAFEGSSQDELFKNAWTHGKGPGWWEIPYPVFENGNRVHSFYRDMWLAMKSATFEGLADAIKTMAAQGKAPQSILIAGFSMGGGVSTMAITDIIEHIRSTYGSCTSSPQEWAKDRNLGSLVQHLTFAAMAAGDMGFHTVLNQLYVRYQIRAWDFMNHIDWTRHFHDLGFRSWRGHSYILPDAVVGRFQDAFGPQGHFILGYLKSAEWLEGNATDMVQSEYSY